MQERTGKQLAMFPATDNASGILRTFNKCGEGRVVLFKIIVSTDVVDKIYAARLVETGRDKDN